jgi:tRNA (mo5U34)-methyltransferase
MGQSVTNADRERLSALVADRQWYHTIELAPGVVTPGWFDTRKLPDRLPFPASMAGMRCLDVGTFDGFWAFEMERRGAAQVMAIDILNPYAWDWPFGSDAATLEELDRRKRSGSGFEVVAQALNSAVSRRELSIYDLDPDEVGQFDFVYLGSLLLHLRDPIGALSRVRTVARGRLLAVDAVDVRLSRMFPRSPVANLDGRGRPWWWRPNQAALVRMLEAAGFALQAAPQRIRVPAGAGHARRLGIRALRDRTGRELAFAARFGAPHCALLAQRRA